MTYYLAYHSNAYDSDIKVFGIFESIQNARKAIMKEIVAFNELDKEDEKLALKELVENDSYDEADSEMVWKIEKHNITK